MYDFDFILVLLCPLDTGGHVACLLPSVSSSDTEWRGPITNGVLLLLQCYSKLDRSITHYIMSAPYISTNELHGSGVNEHTSEIWK